VSGNAGTGPSPSHGWPAYLRDRDPSGCIMREKAGSNSAFENDDTWTLTGVTHAAARARVLLWVPVPGHASSENSFP
jgi:hypothetical protein